mgnify:CR=1 FL=1
MAEIIDAVVIGAGLAGLKIVVVAIRVYSHVRGVIKGDLVLRS